MVYLINIGFDSPWYASSIVNYVSVKQIQNVPTANRRESRRYAVVRQHHVLCDFRAACIRLLDVTLRSFLAELCVRFHRLGRRT